MPAVVPIESIYQSDFFVTVLNANTQVWYDGDTYDFIQAPKKQHLFLYFCGCSAEYTLSDGTKVTARPGDISYAPEGCTYHVRFFDAQPGSYNAVAINFKLYDDGFEPFAFSHDIRIYHVHDHDLIKNMFLGIAEYSRYAVCPHAKIKAFFYHLLDDLSAYFREEKLILPHFNIIARGIRALESDSLTDQSVHDLAKLCNVSEVYFRRLFRQYAGVSPAEYKLRAKIEKAKQYLLFGNKSIKEIAGILGFESASYFCRVFRKRVGVVPSEYVKSYGMLP